MNFKNAKVITEKTAKEAMKMSEEQDFAYQDCASEAYTN